MSKPLDWQKVKFGITRPVKGLLARPKIKPRTARLAKGQRQH